MNVSPSLESSSGESSWASTQVSERAPWTIRASLQKRPVGSTDHEQTTLRISERMDRRHHRNSGDRHQERDDGAVVLLAAFGGKVFQQHELGGAVTSRDPVTIARGLTKGWS